MSVKTLHIGSKQIPTSDKIIDFSSRKSQRDFQQERIVRISPEYEGTSILYSNNKIHDNKLFTMKLLCWGIRANGEVVGMIPWLNSVIPCTELQDPDYGFFEGYYDSTTEEVFYTAPPHKVIELETATRHFSNTDFSSHNILQEIPDNIGTHALLNAHDDHSVILTEVLSWRLLGSGDIQAMLIEEKNVNSTPVLPGDPCLYPAQDNKDFRYFFQHYVANQIKDEDPDALAAIALLFK